MTVDCSIVIATYNRPEGLAQTLASCLGQTNALGLTGEIVVLDNHPTQSGQPVAEAAKGTRRLAIAAPGFAADCLETREELAIRGREVFAAAGNRVYRLSPRTGRVTVYA